MICHYCLRRPRLRAKTHACKECFVYLNSLPPAYMWRLVEVAREHARDRKRGGRAA